MEAHGTIDARSDVLERESNKKNIVQKKDIGDHNLKHLQPSGKHFHKY
jgi:hypothetical protein